MQNEKIQIKEAVENPTDLQIKTPKFNLPPEEKIDIGVAKALREEDTNKQKSLKERIMGMFTQSEEKILAKAEERLKNNPMLLSEMRSMEQEYPEKAKKWKLALGKYTYTKWDEKKNDYVDTSKYTEFVNK